MEENQEYRQITLDEWLYWKEDIRNKLRETAENFVYIGYRLKQIRDSGMYDGAEDIFEFARKEYGLGKSTVSRFIAINGKFSEGGNSPELKAEYREIGSSKLSEMLTLPDAECSLITGRTTVKEIRELKSFLGQQPQEEQEGSAQEAPETDTGTGTEGAEAAPGNTESGEERKESGTEPDNGGGSREMTAAGEEKEAEMTPLEKCLMDYFRDREELLNAVIPLIYAGKYDRAMDLINPSGYATYRKGMVFLFLYDFTQGVKYKVFGQPEVCALSWEEFLLQIYNIYSNLYEAGEENIHGACYGKPAPGPEKELPQESGKTGKASKVQDSPPAVATSQQKEKRQKEKKQKTLSETDNSLEEQLPGQMQAEDYPELMPESSYEEIKEEPGSRREEQEEPDTEPKAARDGGGADPWEEIRAQSYAEVWEELTAAEKGLSRFIWSWKDMDPAAFPREHLEEAYKDAVDLAAALEKLMIARDTDGKIDHA